MLLRELSPELNESKLNKAKHKSLIHTGKGNAFRSKMKTKTCWCTWHVISAAYHLVFAQFLLVSTTETHTLPISLMASFASCITKKASLKAYSKLWPLNRCN